MYIAKKQWVLEQIFKRHNEWIRIAIYVGCPNHLAEDLVQDFYIKLMEIEEREGTLERLMQNGQFNVYYAFSTIKNMFLMTLRQPKQVRLSEYNLGASEEAHEFEEAYNHLIQSINQTLDDMHWYNKKLMLTYIEEGHSIRSLAKATHISARSIQTTLSNVKSEIRKECAKEYNSYKEEKHKAE